MSLLLGLYMFPCFRMNGECKNSCQGPEEAEKEWSEEEG